MIKIENLVKCYDDVVALKGVSFTVEKGEIFGLLGPNGAGKTTLMEILCGLRRLDKGKVIVLDIDVSRRPDKAKRLLGFCPQETLLYKYLTVRENLVFAASLYSLRSREVEERIKFLVKFLDIEEILKKRVDKLSGGMKRRVSLAASIVHDPKIIVLDEPTVGFDPHVKREFWQFIKQLHEDGKTILLSTHNMEEADELCDRVAIMDSGKIVAIDKPETLKRIYGGNAVINVKVKDFHMEKAEKILHKLKPKRENNELKIFVNDPWKLMPEVSSMLFAKGVLAEKIEVTEPTLEDVFINLTGKRLMEGVN
jgi:ABC-2 type transport system ATP-binding protein